MMPPVRAFIAAMMSRTFDEEALLTVADNNDKGAIFCHVERIRQFLQEIEDIIDGYQKWQGKAPNFRRRADIKATNIKILILGW
jgi:hypothetical protein